MRIRVGGILRGRDLVKVGVSTAKSTHGVAELGLAMPTGTQAFVDMQVVQVREL